MRCVALFSGGLDSQLAIRIMQEQGVEVEALSFRTMFSCCENQPALVARQLNVQLTFLDQDDDFLDVIRNPRFGYGRGANPCVDCRIYMFQRARRFMEQIGAQFVVSGEVVGQRPMSQKRRDLEVISHHSLLQDLLVRPLSAQLLPVTRPEREGWIDRAQLFRFFGRGRRKLIRLAHSLGIEVIPAPSTGCALTERRFSLKVFDLIRHHSSSGSWDFELLKHGRHFRFNEHCKVVVGRREAENAHLEYLHQLPDGQSSVLLAPDGFPGPMALVIGPVGDEVLNFACGLIRRYSNNCDDESALTIRASRRDGFYQMGLVARSHPAAADATSVASR